MYKKIFNKLALAGGTLGVIIAGAAAFSAFEAHVVNVTAKIENAITVPQELGGIGFGTVFPEEVLHKNLDISFSQSFLDEDRVDDVSYMIRQKPKCGIPVPQTASGTPVSYSGFVQVTDVQGTFVCPEGSVQLPLLCPYLSKHELSEQCTISDIPGQSTCPGIDAFHGTTTNWTLADTINTQVLGHIQKDVDPSDTWDIDLHAPCFKGQCAQDNVIPASFEADPALEHQIFGCDLWVEVTGISLPEDHEDRGLLTVTKIVIGTSTPVSNFSLFVDGTAVTSGVATSTSLGAHVVSEGAHVGFDSVIGGDCDTGGNVTVSTSTPKSCTITNTLIVETPSNGTLTINKVLDPAQDPGLFDLQIDAVTDPNADDIGNGGSTGAESFLAGSVHTFGEVAGTGTSLADYTSVISGPADCDDGSVTIVALTNITCTITNTRSGGTLIINKVIDNSDGVGSKTAVDFSYTVNAGGSTAFEADGSNSQGVVPGNYTVVENADADYTTTYSNSLNGNLNCDNLAVPSNGSATCTITNTAKFFTLTVTKTVLNNNGGTATTSDFSFFVDGTPVGTGVPKKFAPGTYTVTESGLFGYAATFGGDCDANSQQVSGTAGQVKNCTILNDDIPPVISLTKNVVGGSALATSFIMRVDGVPVPTGGSKSVTANASHFITEDAHAGYTLTGITGAGCPPDTTTAVVLTPGQSISCTVTNTANP